jgi:anti-sigma factor RsiW
VSDRCPASAELLAYALGGPHEPVSEGIARHVRGCPSCEADARRLRETADALRSVAGEGTADVGPCLDELTIASVVDGEPPAAERPHVLAHLAGCPRCRGQLASLARLLRDPAVAAARRQVEQVNRQARSPLPRIRLGSRSWIRGATALTGLAAAAILLVVLRSDDAGHASTRGTSRSDTPVYREQAVTRTGPPRLIMPVGLVPSADTLRWTSVPYADRYRATVFDRDGNIAYEAQTADTALAMPAALRAERGRLYLWRVEARTSWDRWVESELVEFTLSPVRSPKR